MQESCRDTRVYTVASNPCLLQASDTDWLTCNSLLLLLYRYVCLCLVCQMTRSFRDRPRQYTKSHWPIFFPVPTVRTVDLTFTVAYKTLRSTSTSVMIGCCPNFPANQHAVFRARVHLDFVHVIWYLFLTDLRLPHGGGGGSGCRSVKDASLITVTGIWRSPSFRYCECDYYYHQFI